MNKTEFSRMASVIKGYYPNVQISDNADVMSVWWEAFNKYEVNVVIDAIKTYGESNKFAPSIADIKELIKNNVRIRREGNNCPHCNGRGYVLKHIVNQALLDLYGGNDYANDFAVTCEYCNGWKWDSVERKVIRQ